MNIRNNELSKNTCECTFTTNFNYSDSFEHYQVQKYFTFNDGFPIEA